jgi:polysaccharide export outer membrane protein
VAKFVADGLTLIPERGITPDEIHLSGDSCQLARNRGWAVAGPGTERKTKHESGIFPRCFRVFAAILPLVSTYSLAGAQSETDVRDRIQASGHSESEVRQRIQDSGLTPEQVRRKLRDAGYSPEALDPYLRESSVARPKRLPVSQSIAPESVSYADTTGDSTRVPGPKWALARGIAQEPESLPEFTKEIMKRVPAAQPVFPFGYEIFRYAPSTFEPLGSGPVDPEYPIGPGDELVISVWGDNQYTYTSLVTREATISVPDIGQVVVNGLTLAQARRLVTDRFSTVYSGIHARRPTTFVDVTLGKLRTNQVFILGDVVRPGGYTISSVSTVLNALYNAGGPTPRGSMRDVRIIRHNDLYRRVDLYGYILTGNRTEDVRLQSGDIIFVPPIGKTIAVLGEVHRPAIYEVKAGERFHELLRLSGGVLATALLDRMQIDRIVPFTERDSLRGSDRVALDMPLRAILADSTQDPELLDRDIIQVFRIGDVRKNTVSISGSVIRHPGTFQITPGMHVSDLVQAAGGYTPDTYLDRAVLVRTAPDLSQSIRRFNIGKAAAKDPEQDLPLTELDAVYVASVWDIRDRHVVEITGNVRKPGTYDYLNGMTIMDLIFASGGLKESASKQEAEVSRVDSMAIATTKGARIYHVPISQDYGIHSQDTSFVLKEYDEIFVREMPDWQLQRNVSITGEVKYPGVYSLKSKDERLSSLITRAGGLKPTAYPRAATFTRFKGNAGRLAVDVESVAKKHKHRNDLALEDGDMIDIPKEPKTVKVTGEVGSPASVLYEGGRSIGYYVDQAGGYTENSDRKRVRFVLPNGRVKTAKKFWFDPNPGPGAVVVVPAKPPSQNKDTLKGVATIVGIISGAATTIFLAHAATK